MKSLLFFSLKQAMVALGSQQGNQGELRRQPVDGLVASLIYYVSLSVFPKYLITMD